MTYVQVLEPPSAGEPQQAASQNDGRHRALADAERFVHAVNRKRRERVLLRVASRVGARRGAQECRDGIELRHQAVQGRRRGLGVRHQCDPPCAGGFGFGFRKQRPDLEDRNHRQQPDEEEHQRQEEPDRASERHEVPDRRVIHLPRRGQEVAMEARHDDDEALEPHADVDEHADPEHDEHVLAYPLRPEQLRER